MTPTRRAALTTALTGFAFQVVAFLTNALTLSLESPRLAQACSFGISLGGAIVVLGCFQLARAKGQPGYVALLGLLSGLGIALVWYAVPDKTDPPRA